MAGSDFEMDGFAYETRMLAEELGSVFEGEQLQPRVVEALRLADEGWTTS